MSVERFRARYRAHIHPSYRAWRHALAVLCIGVTLIAAFLSSAEAITVWQYLSIVPTLMLFNVGEYVVHKKLGHRKTRFGRLFYQRHTGDHHSFFSEQHMPYEQARDWRVILFPTYLVCLQGVGALMIWLLLRMFNNNLAAVVAATWLAGYLLYELFHALEHLPDEHALSRLPWIRQMRTLHALHHRRDVMHRYNFNIVFPFADWLFGTLYWGSKAPLAPCNKAT